MFSLRSFFTALWRGVLNFMNSDNTTRADDLDKLGDYCDNASNALSTLGDHNLQDKATQASVFFHGLASQFRGTSSDHTALWLFTHLSLMQSLSSDLTVVSRRLTNSGFVAIGKALSTVIQELDTMCKSITQ